MSELYDPMGQVINVPGMYVQRMADVPLRADFVHEWIDEWRKLWASKDAAKILRNNLIWKNPEDIGRKK